MTDQIRTSPLDVKAIREDFPILYQELRPGIPLVYLDNAATSQKPRSVIDAMTNYYLYDNSNIHRGIHTLSERATNAYEDARKRIGVFINAASWREIIFVRNTTEAINLVAWTWGRQNIREGDVILSTQMEHHANIVPWQILAAERGAELKFVPMVGDSGLDLDAFTRMLDKRVKLLVFNHVSNSTGAIQPAEVMIAAAHQAGAVVALDGAQSVPHRRVDVQALDVDFFSFSSHKMLGPTGIGVLYGKRDILDAMPPFMGGGDMIKRVTLEGTTYNDLPYKFEAGTPSIAEVIGFGAAVDYLNGVGMDAIHAHEIAITAYVLERLAEVPGLRVLGPQKAEDRAGLAAFTLDGVHPHDAAQVLDHYGIAVRAGHHCTQPVHAYYRIPASARASFYLYNTFEEVDRLIDGLHKVRETFGLV